MVAEDPQGFAALAAVSLSLLHSLLAPLSFVLLTLPARDRHVEEIHGYALLSMRVTTTAR